MIINRTLFKEDSSTGINFIFLLFLSILLMFLDHQSDRFHQVHAKFNLVAVPFQYVVSLPNDLLQWTLATFTFKENLIQENAALKAELLLLNAKLEKQVTLESENEQLRALLESSASVEDKVTVAELLSVSMDPSTHQVILNQGQQTGVSVGQTVLDAGGVIGQIIEVGPWTSRVLLITDPRCAVPVQIKRNGVRAIVAGKGSHSVLKLQNVTDTMDVKEGDELITSGLGERYPFGYPVGVVSAIKHSSGESFVDVTVAPSAHLDRSRLVLLVWNTSAKKPNPAGKG